MLFVFNPLTAQRPGGGPGGGMGPGQFDGKIVGRVLDRESEQPVEYANVMLHSMRDSTMVDGAMTDAQGYFRIEKVRPGHYYLAVKFIGYESMEQNSIQLNFEHPYIDMGNIALRRSVIAMDGVQVEADRPVINYEIDKRVIDVSKQATNESGTAVDLLQNIPSLNVDFDGNVTLRGSSSFTVMIDGHPSVLDAADALQTIPASSIERIEIITNPSVKYDPEGMAGIINIITAKKKLSGTSGLVNGSLGTNGELSGDFLVNWKNEDHSWFFKGVYREHDRPSSFSSERITYGDSLNTGLYSEGESSRNFSYKGLEAGWEWRINPRNLLSLSTRVGSFRMKSSSSADLRESQFVESGDGRILLYSSEENSRRGGDFFSLNADYTKSFPSEGHQIVSNLDLRVRDGDEFGLTEEFDTAGLQTSGRKNTEAGPSARIRYKVDYTLPFDEKGKFEAGLEGHTGDIRDETTGDLYVPDLYSYVRQDSLTRDVRYDRSINGIYSQLSNEFGAFGLQAGLRVEHTYRYISSVLEDETFHISRFDWFPSLHTSYQLDGGDQIIASYTRRIQRPRGWFLEPFRTWRDSRNIWQGNPELLPSYTNSYELGYKKLLGQNTVYFDLFHRQTLNVDERITEPLYDDIYLNTVQNVGTSYSTGAEASINLAPLKMWNAFLTLSLYDYQLQGEYETEAGPVNIDTGNTRWDARLTNTFRFSQRFQLQMMNRFESRRVSAQGTGEGMIMTDLSAKINILPNKLSANLQVRDVFRSASHEFTSEGPGFYSHSTFDMQSPQYSISLKYNFNNFKEKREGRGMNGGGDMMEEEF